MRHLRYLQYLRENVIYFTWCTTLFLSRYLWYLRYFAIFCKKHKKSVKQIPQNTAPKTCGCDIFRYLGKTYSICNSVFTAVSVFQGWCGALLVGWLVVVARGLYLARHLFTLFYVSSNFSLYIRVDDIIHANGPIYNSKSDRHDRADEIRQNCRLSKSSFGFCALLLGIPGNFITVDWVLIFLGKV